tara:strand:- start:63 stop:359 length:297 start_codon:yes stop_codon:yes gene_type:complete
MYQQIREMQMNEPEAPSPAPVPQASVIYAEPIENHNNGEIIQLKEKLKVLEEENKSLKKYILSEGRCPMCATLSMREEQSRDHVPQERRYDFRRCGNR